MTMLEKYNSDHCNPASHLKHISMVVICEIDYAEFFRCSVEHEWLYASSDTDNLKTTVNIQVFRVLFIIAFIRN